MTHKSQQIRKQNLDTIVKLVARAMPKGARHRYLQAVLGATYGFHRRTIAEYLRDLQDSERLVCDEAGEVWRLPDK